MAKQDLLEGSPSQPRRKLGGSKYADGERRGSGPRVDMEKNGKVLRKGNGALEENGLEKWEKNYVPYAENDDDVTRTVQNSNGKTPVRAENQISTEESDATLVRKVSEIFEEVFKIPRGNWSFKIEYFLASLTVPIAFNTLWRFPILISTYGGGAFLFSYIILTLLVGIPFYFMESAVSQYAQLSCVHIWRCAPLMQGVGVGMVLLSIITSIYNSQLVAYAVHYFFASFVNTDGSVLWGECRPHWANCYDFTKDNVCSKANTPDGSTDECFRGLFSSSKNYWEDKVLRLSELGDIGRTGPVHWDLTLCLVFVWVCAFVILVKGIKSAGKVAYVSGVFPIGVLLVFLIRALLLPGSARALHVFYEADWRRLAEPDVWIASLHQLIFSLVIVYGSVITFSSYKKIRSTVQFGPVFLVVANLVLAVLASTTVFAMLGALAFHLGIENPKILLDTRVSGIEVLFTRIPEMISLVLPMPHAWAVFYFLMLLCFGLQSQVALVETALTAVYDSMPKLRKKKLMVAGCFVMPLFLLSLPLSSSTGLHLDRILESSIIGPNVVLLAIFEIIGLQLCYGIRRFSSDLQVILKTTLSIYWKVCLVFVCPVTLIVLFVFSCINWRSLLYEGRRDDKEWALYLSWALSLLPLAMIPLAFVFTIFKKLCTREPICQPSYLWAPGCPKVREEMAEMAKVQEENYQGDDNEAYNQN